MIKEGGSFVWFHGCNKNVENDKAMSDTVGKIVVDISLKTSPSSEKDCLGENLFVYL